MITVFMIFFCLALGVWLGFEIYDTNHWEG